MVEPPEDVVKKIILDALREDLGDGDITTNSIVPVDFQYTGQFITRADGVVAGLKIARLTFQELDNSIHFETTFSEGDPVFAGNVLARISGSARALLSAERVALNFLQRMSGIATLTRKYVEAVKNTAAVILDTRKTVPGLRVLDKWAVRLGGGQNHRFGLNDMALIKENHITVAGGITEAVRRVREQDDLKRMIEVEVTSLAELREALIAGVDRIMLDNMTSEQMRQAVRITAGRVPLEASGNVSLETAAQIAATGVDFISVGRLTHSVPALDISLLLQATSQSTPNAQPVNNGITT